MTWSWRDIWNYFIYPPITRFGLLPRMLHADGWTRGWSRACERSCEKCVVRRRGLPHPIALLWAIQKIINKKVPENHEFASKPVIGRKYAILVSGWRKEGNRLVTSSLMNIGRRWCNNRLKTSRRFGERSMEIRRKVDGGSAKGRWRFGEKAIEWWSSAVVNSRICGFMSDFNIFSVGWRSVKITWSILTKNNNKAKWSTRNSKEKDWRKKILWRFMNDGRAPGGSNKSDCNSSKQWANYSYDEDYLLDRVSSLCS